MSNVDDPDWIKGLVAKALLHAASEESPAAAPMGSDAPAVSEAPVVRPAAAWPEIQPLDTSSFAPPREPIPSPVDVAPPAQAPAPAPMAPPAQIATPIEVAPPAQIPTPVPDAVLNSIASERHEHVAMPEPHGSGVGGVGAVLAPIERPPQSQSLVPATSVVPRDGDLSSGPQDHTIGGPGTDDVMVEAAATTEGFRSSDIRTVLEWLAVIISALVVALVIKALVLQAFWIPSESMETTVNKGDRILVNKVSYRLHEVRRGDLVVFEKLEGTPGDTKDLIKRAIALPGETIEIRSDGRIWIWGPGETPDDAKLLEEPYLDPQNAVLNAPSASDPLTADVWDENCVNQPRTPGRCQLDDSSFFMMGDNRGRSSDSRFFGPVPEENVVGRAFLRIWPLGEIGTL